jgi:hypothetical protein
MIVTTTGRLLTRVWMPFTRTWTVEGISSGQYQTQLFVRRIVRDDFHNAMLHAPTLHMSWIELRGTFYAATITVSTLQRFAR